jgi:Protein of unknown function (DUF2652)
VAEPVQRELIVARRRGDVTGRALLVIADIGGYTPFMRLHRTSLAHAQDVVARLLEAMIDAAPNLSLLEVEGDAAFLYTWTPEGQETSTVRTGVDQMVAMHRAFHACQQQHHRAEHLQLRGLPTGRLPAGEVRRPPWATSRSNG